MELSRRHFVRTLGIGTAAATLRPSELVGAPSAAQAPAAPGARALASVIRIDSNENPYGPGPAVLEAITRSFGVANRYPRSASGALGRAIGQHHGLSSDRVLLGCGSGELLRAAAATFTSPTRAAVIAVPTYETIGDTASRLGHPVRGIPVDAALRLDLDAMEKASTGAGLVYVCNPNNPTATIRSARDIEALVGRVLAASPETHILIDEAYHHFVDDPSYATALPLTDKSPRVIVLRTFSKIYGIAGLRVGYAIAHPETLATMSRSVGFGTMSVLSSEAALAALADPARVREQQRLNRETRQATRQLFEGMGYKVAVSEANFLMVEVRRPASEIRSACRERGVQIGRTFPPLDTWARITIGTAEEMQRAAEVFKAVLGAAPSAARHGVAASPAGSEAA